MNGKTIFHKVFFGVGTALFAAACAISFAANMNFMGTTFLITLTVHASFWFLKNKLLAENGEDTRAVVTGYCFLVFIETAASLGVFLSYGSLALWVGAATIHYVQYALTVLCITYATMYAFTETARLNGALLHKKNCLLNGGMPKAVSAVSLYFTLMVYAAIEVTLLIHLFTTSYIGPLWLLAVFAAYALFAWIGNICLADNGSTVSACLFVLTCTAKVAIPLAILSVFIPVASLAKSYAVELAYTVSIYAVAVLICLGTLTDAITAFFAIKYVSNKNKVA